MARGVGRGVAKFYLLFYSAHPRLGPRNRPPERPVLGSYCCPMMLPVSLGPLLVPTTVGIGAFAAGASFLATFWKLTESCAFALALATSGTQIPHS